MAQPRTFKSHDAVTSDGAGESKLTSAHDRWGLFVQLENLTAAPDETVFEARLEASMDGVNYAPVNTAAGDDVFFLDGNDFVEGEDADTYVAFLGDHAYVCEHIRANIVTHDGTFEATTWVTLSGWSQQGTLLQSVESRTLG